jgi:hypothetical protein
MFAAVDQAGLTAVQGHLELLFDEAVRWTRRGKMISHVA